MNKIKEKFEKFLHAMGKHKWNTQRRYFCKVPVSNTFTGRLVGKFDGETLFQECTFHGCNKVRCLVVTGNYSDEFDVGVLARSAIRNMPNLVEDKFMMELSKL